MFNSDLLLAGAKFALQISIFLFLMAGEPLLNYKLYISIYAYTYIKLYKHTFFFSLSLIFF